MTLDVPVAGLFGRRHLNNKINTPNNRRGSQVCSANQHFLFAIAARRQSASVWRTTKTTLILRGTISVNFDLHAKFDFN